MLEAKETMMTGMYYSDKCQFCHEFGRKAAPYLCLDCKEKIHKFEQQRVARLLDEIETGLTERGIIATHWTWWQILKGKYLNVGEETEGVKQSWPLLPE